MCCGWCTARPPQVLYHADGELEELEYEVEAGGDGGGGGLAATLHDMAPLEGRGAWARFW